MGLPHVPDEHLKAIAHVAIRSAQLDHMIEFLLAKLFHSNMRTAEMVLKEWTQNKQVKLIRAILEDRYPWHKADIGAFLDALSEARRERNDVIHYLWGKADESGAASTGSYRPFRAPKTQSKTAAEVDAVAEKLLQFVNTIHALMAWLDDDPQFPPNLLAHTLQRSGSVWPLGRDQQAPPQAPSPPQSPRQKSDHEP